MRKVFERYLKPEEEKRLVATIKLSPAREARRDLGWIQAMQATGVRVAAFARLDVSDARRAIATSYLTLREKGGRTHTVYVTRAGVAALKSLIRVRADYDAGADGPLVVGRRNRRLSIRSYQSRMAYWCQLAGLGVHASPHWLRHTRAKRIMSRSTAADPVGIVQAVLGHKSRNTTAIYTLPDREEIELAMEEAG